MTLLSDRQVERLRSTVATQELLAGRYGLREPLGYGGMSTVYLARDEILARDVALKIMDFVDAADESQALLSVEAQVLAQLEHPGIVPVHDLGRTPEGGIFYVMKLIVGQTFDAYCTTGAPLAQRIRVLQRVCETLAFAHARGVVHRDLTPANVMVGEFGEVLILDWGLAMRRTDTGTPQIPAEGTSRLRAGTPGYVAPELRDGLAHAVAPAVDVYALGGLLLRAIAGSETQGASEHAAELAPLAAVAGKARMPSAAERYDSALAFADDLANYLEHRRVSAYRERWYETAKRWLLKYQFLVSLIVAYLLMRVLIALST